MKREPLARHILPSSATMVGVCLTAISLVKLLENKNGEASAVDEYLALNSVIFLFCAGLSYFSLRPYARPQWAERMEKLADVLFIVGLSVMVVITTLFAYEGI